ncbi:MAG: threonine synthase [Parasphingorhabdus sp.]|jgi:threonine synthase
MDSPPTFIDPITNKTYPIDVPCWRAPNGSPLLISTLSGIKRSEIDQTKGSIWRYAKTLPIPIQDPITLGEGCTPLIKKTYEGIDCHFKLEWFSPTGSFKDRGTSVMLSVLKQQGITTVIEDSSGNGGASVAAYGAAAGMAVKILVPASTQPAKIAQIRAYGAQVVLVPGPREATEEAAIKMADEAFYASHN